MAEPGIAWQVLVGADEHAAHLRRKPVEDPLHQRAPVKFLQALVDAAHATAGAAGQYDAGDRRAHRRTRSHTIATP